MKKVLILPILLICFLFVFSSPTLAAYFSYSPSSGTISSGDTVQVKLDTQNADVESATAVLTFDQSKVEISDINAGSFFDSISIDESQAGEVVLTATLNLNNRSPVNGTGVIATITLNPLISSGSFNLGFACSSTSIDDSNIMNAAGDNLLASNEQCGVNVEGSYTTGSISSPTATPTNATTNDNSTSNTVSVRQPVQPNELPQTGPKDWLKWFVSGLTLIGVGLLIL